MNETAETAARIGEAAERFAAECARATDGQWSFRRDATQWSMAHVTEHVALSNRNIFQMLSKHLLHSPRDGRSTGVIDVEIPYLFYRGGDEPPNVAAPTGTWTKAAAAEALLDGARAIVEWSGRVDGELREAAIAHPVFGLLDGIQWLLFTTAHMERHRAQLIGLKQHGDFPR
jgi:hypothetical protein